MRSIDPESWTVARRIVRRGLRSSLHCSVASLDPDGTPHVTPIGSVMLLADPGRAMYFDVFNAGLSRNVDRDPRVCVLAVDSRKPMWVGALLRGRFVDPPGVQLKGTVGARRDATDAEVARFEQAVRPALWTRGGRTLWSDIALVRDLTVESMSTLRLGAMTRGSSTRAVPSSA